MKIKKTKKSDFKKFFAGTKAVSERHIQLIAWICGSVLAVVISACILGSIVYGDNPPDLSIQSDTSSSTTQNDPAMARLESNKAFDRIIDMNGVVGIDGSLRVLEANYTKTFDLVEESTPVVAAANHARIFLRADGTKQSIVIGWDDGTYSRVAGN